MRFERRYETLFDPEEKLGNVETLATWTILQRGQTTSFLFRNPTGLSTAASSKKGRLSQDRKHLSQVSTDYLSIMLIGGLVVVYMIWMQNA
jgi:hypothetical protein